MTAQDDLGRFFAELHAAPTRCEANNVFYGHDWLFAKMTCAERERAYAAVADIIREKPD